MLFLCLVIVGLFFALYGMYKQTLKAKVNTDVTAQVLFDLVNKEREKAGIAPLTWDDRLAASARYKAADMEEFGYFGHQKPGSSENNGVLQAYTNTGRECKWISENILDGAGTTVAQDDISSWMGSKSHREAILDPKYDKAGLSIVGQSAVQHFCDLAQ